MIDLRSDILAGWSIQALEAFSTAVHDKPGFVRDEDSHLRALEAFAAEAFGVESALFLPTCTMANQVAIRIWCPPDRTILLDQRCHIAVNELASTTQLNRAQLRFIESERGHITPKAVENALASPLQAEDRYALVVVENTHNRAGGTVMPTGWMAEIADVCQRRETPLHLDGARLWNAAVTSGNTLATLAEGVSSVSVSLNKSIGAPVGALLMGTREFIGEAAQIQQVLGGLWRPVGTLAAAALQAARNFRMRAERDHDRAATLSESLRQNLPEGSGVDEPETNIVMLRLPTENLVQAALEAMARHGVLAAAYGERRIRLVVHAGIHDEALQQAATTILSCVSECCGSRVASHVSLADIDDPVPAGSSAPSP